MKKRIRVTVSKEYEVTILALVSLTAPKNRGILGDQVDPRQEKAFVQKQIVHDLAFGSGDFELSRLSEVLFQSKGETILIKAIGSEDSGCEEQQAKGAGKLGCSAFGSYRPFYEAVAEVCQATAGSDRTDPDFNRRLSRLHQTGERQQRPMP
jgi:hypothetical protein